MPHAPSGAGLFPLPPDASFRGKRPACVSSGDDPQPLIERGWVVPSPSPYEDFSRSAPGIFQSNLGE